MAATTDHIKALAVFLKADSTVAGLVQTRVWGGEVPDSEVVHMPRPSVMLRPTGGNNLMGSSYLELTDPRVDISSYGRTPQEADQVYRAVYGALKQMRRNVSAGVLLHWAHPEVNGFSLRDPDTEWPFTLSVWQVLVSERTVA